MMTGTEMDLNHQLITLQYKNKVLQTRIEKLEKQLYYSRMETVLMELRQVFTIRANVNLSLNIHRLRMQSICNNLKNSKPKSKQQINQVLEDLPNVSKEPEKIENNCLVM